MENKVSLQLLNERLNWSLDEKIDHALGVVDQIYSKNNGNIYVSYSGGKDSVVMLHISRILDANIKALFFNNGNEHAEIVRFVRNTPNVKEVVVNHRLKDIIKKYGFPLISKDVSKMINEYRHTKNEKRKEYLISKSTPSAYRIPDKYKFLIDAPFDVSNICCEYLRKRPSKSFQNKNNYCGMLIGTTVEESGLRQRSHLKTGCFNELKNKAMPISIFTEKNIYECIEKFNLKIPNLYAKGCLRTGCRACGFGITQMDGKLHWNYLKKYKPKQFELAMNLENNGIKFREVLEYCKIKI